MNTGTDLSQLKVSLWNTAYLQWKSEVLFSNQWWLIIATIVISYIVWWVLIDKTRFAQLLLFGSLVSVGRIVFDIIGSNMVLWSYDIRESPFMPSPFLHNLTISPLVYMLLHQYTSTWRTFLLWNAIITAAYSFILLPFLVSTKVLTFYNWNYMYAFISVFFITSLSRIVSVGAQNLEKRASKF